MDQHAPMVAENILIVIAMIRKTFLWSVAFCFFFAGIGNAQPAPPQPCGPVPTENQWRWQQMEYYAFLHFSINTFTDQEWGSGGDDPKIFNPDSLDCRQWARICKEAGMKGIILTAKHHSGFCLWPSKYTEYSVKNCPWKNGKGDIVRELAEACKEYGLKLGIYLSPWDRNYAGYGKPEYITYFRNQLRELLTQYGDIFEIWFDGANGGSGYYGGANETRTIDRKTYYDWKNTYKLIRKLQPKIVIWNDGGDRGDLRWVGTEAGNVGETNWSLLDSTGEVTWNMLHYGLENGNAWVPAEVNTSIRPGWFYHEYEDAKVKTLPQLLDIYYSSFGRNGTLLLNFPIDRHGLIHPNDEKAAVQLAAAVKEAFAVNLAEKARVTASNVRGHAEAFGAGMATDGKKETYWATDDGVTTASMTLDFGRPVAFNCFMAQEYIRLGQRVKSFSVEAMVDGSWKELAKATTIGYRRILRFPRVRSAQLRFTVTDAKACPVISNIGVFDVAPVPTQPVIAREQFDIPHTSWKIVGTDDPKAAAIIDGDPHTAWHQHGEKKMPVDVVIDLGRMVNLAGFRYLPDQDRHEGVITTYQLFVSKDGQQWQLTNEGEFSNINNNPLWQVKKFSPVNARYIKLRALHNARGNDDAGYAEIDVITEPASVPVAGEGVSLTAPGGRIVFHLDNDPGGLVYSINYQQKEIISRGRMGFEFMKEPALGAGLSIVKKETFAVRNTWNPVVRVKKARVDDHYNALRLLLKEDTGLRRCLELEVRAYDDGIAFRYKLPAAGVIGDRVITRERTGFPVSGDAKAWVAQYGGYASSQESEFKPVWLRDLNRQTVAGLPMLIRVDTSVFAAITEADIDHYPGSYIGSDSLQDGHVMLTTRLAPLPGETVDGAKARFNGDVYTPWRVIMLADSPGRLIESSIIENLNPPCAIKDPSWIKPGISAWDHWWSGEVKMDMPTIRQYIDLAASQGWPYMLVDWQWYGPFNDPRADITRAAPQLDMPALLAYAASKQVRLWLWLYSSDVNRNDNYEKAFALYEKWGIAGIKIDFMDRDDQQMVDWYHRIIKAAADHHLLIDLHGAYKPDGIRRTYPNLLTREGVMGEEYSKFSNRITPEHNVTLPFTRMLAGPMDYTPGGFLNVTPEEFRQGVPTEVKNTRVAELSKFVIYESPFTVYCDAPEHITGQPGAEFLRLVKTVWDDTKVLAGYPGQYVVVARRSGSRWFIGAMTGEEARDITVNLDFLPKGAYELVSWEDATDAGSHPQNLLTRRRKISAGDALRISMAKGGGFVGYLDKR